MLRLESVSKGFPQGLLFRKTVPVLTDVSLSIEPGSFVGLVGASGSGKSTLARLMLGLIRPDAGRVLFGGDKDVARLDSGERDVFQRSIQWAAQHPESAFNPRIKAGGSIREVLTRFHKGREEEGEADLTELLNRMQLSPACLSRYPYQLSGGELQRLAVCRALLTHPGLVVLDEVTSMLDVSVQAHIANLLLEIHAERKTSFFLITHNLPLADRICQKVYHMVGGRLLS